MDWHLSCIQLLTEELSDSTNPLTAVLYRCGQAICDDLRLNAENIVAGAAIQLSCANLEVLINEARRNIASSSAGYSLTGWLRLYADACILRSLADVGPLTATQSIARLDNVLITCGPASGRLDLIFSIIKDIQNSYMPVNRPLPSVDAHLATSGSHSPAQLDSLRSSILTLSESPSFHSFQSMLHRQPFIACRYAEAWPAMTEHPWRSAVYLRSVSGPGRIIPVEIGEDYRDLEWRQELMKWDDFLASLHLSDQPPPPKCSSTVYLAQHNLLSQFPSLRADIIVPDYVYASMDPPEFNGYSPPGNDERLLINMWLGPKGTVSPAHTDPYYNLFVQVVGRKTVWLAPPKLTPFMYPYSSADAFHNSAANLAEHSMSNTSRVDVFSTKTEEFPNFANAVVPEAMTAVLEPGDLLYIPPGWWHAMRSEETSFSVSFWF
ncbi:hypothetical protein FPV67DRAFT_1463986 [Lyophyllum atratum]|nr:hypothetical protein FPV67DRAFT_1463986 [Lyophyllum atratum]